MPGRDQTGPTGMGPSTGRGAGDCSNTETPGAANTQGGRGRGMGGRGRGGGMGRGLGRRNRLRATGLTDVKQATMDEQSAGSIPPVQESPSPTVEAVGASEVDALKQQTKSMEQQMQRLNERIEQLETDH